MANTPNFALYKPNRADTSVEVDTSLSDNFTKIDTELKNNKDGLDTHKNNPNAHNSENVSHADGSVKTTLENHEERIGGLETDADALETRVNDIETLGLDVLAPNLEGRIQTIESDVEGFLAPATFDAMDNQSYTFDEYRIGYVDSRLAKFLPLGSKLKGVDVPVYLAYTTADLQASILDAKNSGANLAILSIKYTQNPTDNTMVVVSENSKLATIIDYCNSIGVAVAVKMHIGTPSNGASVTPTDIPTWFANWQTFCLSNASICQSKGVEYLAIANEMNTMTNGNVSNWQSLINTIKASYPSLKLFLSVNKQEYGSCIIYNLFDVIGFNFYPAMTLNGKNETDINMRTAFYNDLGGTNLIGMIKDLKKTYKKPVWITEIGCPSYADALIETAAFSNLGAYDEETQKFYYQYMFDVVWKSSSIDALSIWGIGERIPANSMFTFQGKQAQAVVEQYWKEV